MPKNSGGNLSFEIQGKPFQFQVRNEIERKTKLLNDILHSPSTSKMFQIRVSSPSTVAFAIGRIQFNRMPKTRFSAIQSKTEIPTSEPNPGQTKLQFPHILSLLPSIAFIVYLLILVLGYSNFISFCFNVGFFYL